MIQVGYPVAKPAGVRMPRAGVRRLLTVLLVAMVGLLTSPAASALAGQARVLTGVFGAAGSDTVDPYPLSYARGAAVDLETHDVYVGDNQNHRVEKFDSAGHFVLMFGKEVDRTTGGNVCTAASGDVCQAGVQGSSPGAFESIDSVAVDNSGVFGQQGDVYVSDIGSNVVSKFNAEGVLLSSWGNNGEGKAKNGPPNGQLNGANAVGKVAGPFTTPEGIAVDRSGNLWVNNAGDIFEFRPDSSFVTSWRSVFYGRGDIAIDLDKDLKDILYIGPLGEEYMSEGTKIGSVIENGIEEGLAVDSASNDLYVAAKSELNTGDAIDRYDASCHPIILPVQKGCVPVESFGSNSIISTDHVGLAIDPSTPGDTIYVAENGARVEHPVSRVLALSVETVPDVITAKATGFTASSAVLAGTVDPAGIELLPGLEGCRFEWGEHGSGEAEPYGHNAPCDKTAAQIGSGTSAVEVHATIGGLQQGKTYHFRVVAANDNQVNGVADEPSLGSDLAFGPPAIESTSATGVGANSATLQAEVNPDNVDTRVRVEYGTEAGVYGGSTPELDIGANGGGQLVPFQLSGLVPHTVYHYRMVAENVLGEEAQAVLSSDHTFITQVTASGFALPDGRAWEMVSPPDKRGGEPFPIQEEDLVQASAAGDAITYIVGAPTETEPAGNDGEVQVLSRRSTDGWVSRDIATPHEGVTGVSVGYGGEYRYFSTDLSLAIVHPLGNFDTQISPEASEQTPYLRTDYPSGKVDSPCVTSCYRPLVTGAAGYENVPAGTIIAPHCGHGKTRICSPEFVGASPDASHVVLTSGVALTEGAPANGLYEWTGGRLVLVSVLPDETPAPATSFPSLGFNGQFAQSAVSSDGSRVVWSASGEGLYVRDVTEDKTVQVGTGKAQFQMASSDGSKILFTEEGDLRECDIVESEGALHCEITDLTPVAPGENAGVNGAIHGEYSSYVYFTANTVLKNGGVPVSGAQSGTCSGGSAGSTCNVNLYVRHNGTIGLVAVLGQDNDLELARVSPNGEWLAFMSTRSLTGYDNRDSVNGSPDSEVYLYDATARGGEGTLVCASCNPTGARPHGHAMVHGELGVLGRESVAASVPTWTAYRLGEALYQSRYLSDSGRLFFDSYDALVPQDTDGTGDVYEYEPPGVGDCTSSSSTFAESSGGCVGLISSGTSKEDSVFVDASEDGHDVFFLTVAQLSHMDTDSATDVYDARVGGGFPEPSAPPACEGDACQSPLGAPEDRTPGSLTYSGPGNPGPSSTGTLAKQKTKTLTSAQKLAKALDACRRDRSKRARSACVRAARKRYGHAKTGRATTKRKGKG